MIRLIRYECSKSFWKKPILGLLILFSTLNLLKIHSEYKDYSYLSDGTDERSWNYVYWQLYDEYKSEITQDKIDALLAIYQPLVDATADMTASTAMDNPNTLTGNLYSDRNLLKKYYADPMGYFYSYQGLAAKVAEKASENVALYQTRGQIFEARKNSVIYHLYADRAITTFAYQEMYNYYLNYDFSTVLILLLCLYGVVGVFVREKETQMDMLLLTSTHGGRKTAAAKVAAATLFVIGISLWFSMLDFAGFALSFGSLEGGNLPIYAIGNFATASVNLSLFQYAIVSAAMKALGVWSIGMILLLASMFWSSALVPFALDFALCFILVITGAGGAYSSNLWAKVLNPYSLLSNRILLGKTEFLNIAGHPILSHQAAVAVWIVMGLIVATAIIFISRKNNHCRTGRIQ